MNEVLSLPGITPAHEKNAWENTKNALVDAFRISPIGIAIY
jgi:hypothetical protein